RLRMALAQRQRELVHDRGEPAFAYAGRDLRPIPVAQRGPVDVDVLKGGVVLVDVLPELVEDGELFSGRGARSPDRIDRLAAVCGRPAAEWHPSRDGVRGNA